MHQYIYTIRKYNNVSIKFDMETVSPKQYMITYTYNA